MNKYMNEYMDIQRFRALMQILFSLYPHLFGIFHHSKYSTSNCLRVFLGGSSYLPAR